MSDLAYAQLLAKTKGIKIPKDLPKKLGTATNTTVTSLFNTSNWDYALNGFTVESARAAQLLAKTETLSTAVTNLIGQGVVVDEQFFVISSSAKYNEHFTNEDLNLIVADFVKGEQRKGLRNYFLERATLS